MTNAKEYLMVKQAWDHYRFSFHCIALQGLRTGISVVQYHTFTVGQEEEAFVANKVVHPGESFIHDNDIGVADGGTEEECYTLCGEGKFAEEGVRSPCQTRRRGGAILVPWVQLCFKPTKASVYSLRGIVI
jgi:hypothetical protein